MKQTGSLRTALACCIGLSLMCALAPAARAENGQARFADVPENAWYYDSAYFCREAEIFVGDQAGNFQPDRAITAQEGHVLLARLHQRKTGDTQPLVPAPGESWSDPYLRYCVEHQIVPKTGKTGSVVLSREEFVRGLSRIYDRADLQRINDVMTLADYPMSTGLGQFVLALYQAGVLNGTDPYGRFSPRGELSRAECATVIARLLAPRLRLSFEAAPPLEVELGFLPAADRVYDFDGVYIYLVDNSQEVPTYRVVDLYGQTILRSRDWIERQAGGIFSLYDGDANMSFHYNAQGELIFSCPQHRTGDTGFAFAYGKLAVKQNEGEILVVDDQGATLGIVQGMENYRPVGAALGDYIPVVPDENRRDGCSYWLDYRSGEVREVPYEVEGYSAKYGLGYLVVEHYDRAAGRRFYNAMDPSLNLLFPHRMESVEICANGLLWAEDDEAYYALAPGGEMETYPKSQWGTIREISPSGTVMTQVGWGEIEVKRLKTGEVCFFSPERNNYTLAGRKMTRPHRAGDETKIDLYDEYGTLEREGISSKDLWYGACGQILYRVGDQYFYISA